MIDLNWESFKNATDEKGQDDIQFGASYLQEEQGSRREGVEANASLRC